MKYTTAIAILREKAEVLEHIHYRLSSAEESCQEQEEKFSENPEESWRLDTIAEYRARIDALQTIMQAVYKC